MPKAEARRMMRYAARTGVTLVIAFVRNDLTVVFTLLKTPAKLNTIHDVLMISQQVVDTLASSIIEDEVVSQESPRLGDFLGH